MNNSVILFLISVFIASVSQIILKSSAKIEHSNMLKEYLNVRVISAYALFFGSSLLTIIAYKNIPLSLGPVLEGTGYIYVALLGYLFLKETMNKKQVLGIVMILIGILVCYFPF